MNNDPRSRFTFRPLTGAAAQIMANALKAAAAAVTQADLDAFQRSRMETGLDPQSSLWLFLNLLHVFSGDIAVVAGEWNEPLFIVTGDTIEDLPNSTLIGQLRAWSVVECNELSHCLQVSDSMQHTVRVARNRRAKADYEIRDLRASLGLPA